MATFGHNLILVLACVVTLLHSINCKPVKRSAADCYGTDCFIPQEELDFNGNPQDTKLLENITASVIRALPEITDLLSNIMHIHQNTTVPALPSIAQSLEDDKNLQTYQNLLIENDTAVTTPILLEMVKLMKSQQEMQERHNQQMQERVDRQYQLQVNQQAMQERHHQWMQEQSERQNKLFENVTTSFQPTSLPQPTRMSQIPQEQSERPNKLLENVTTSFQPTSLPQPTRMSKIQDSSVPHSCISGLSNGQHIILPLNTALGSFPVVCDMDTDGGRWIVLQHRYDGSVNFDRVWDDYATGFGNLDGEFWLGLDKLHVLTSSGDWELRVDLEDFDLNKAYAIYDKFRIGDSSSFYRLDIGSYSGTAGDSMRRHDLNGMAFTTKDRDQDQYGINCAVYRRGAWWHNRCTLASLNGLYLGQYDTSDTGMFWFNWNSFESLRKSELKIRPIEG